MPHPPSPRRRVTASDQALFRQQLIDIARKVFHAEGPRAVTIRRVTSEAGVTAMAFYWYFDNKEALLAAIWDDLIRESAQACEAEAQKAPMPAQLVAYFSAFVDYWLARPEYFRLIFLNEADEGMRQRLVSPAGPQRYFEGYDKFAGAHFGRDPDGIRRATDFRSLALYLVFGFLFSASHLRAYDPARVAQQREVVLGELQRLFLHWCPPA